MKITYNWLKDFIDIDVSAEEIADRLTSAGLEVEEIVYQNEHLHDVVIGKILKIEKHPNAERLQVCSVDIGEKTTQIITSATNVFEGATVPVALPGADLVNGIKIESSKFRGLDSFGMFCSGEEIGIDENYYEGAGINGILILKEEYKPGTKIEDALELNDIMLDVNVTPNRPDCMSVIGIAREVSAILEKPIRLPEISYQTEKSIDINKIISVEVKTSKCSRYMASCVKDIKLAKSPMFIRKRLNAVGIKPINNMVDITNYVLVEFGQPMHAFNYTNIEGKKIIVRQAKENEEITVLNQNTYKLNENDMVIADDKKPIVIAGVIGGTNSCVDDSTTISILESANFDRKSVRITARKIGVRTDSSARFEKGIDLESQEIGMKRALSLVYQLKAGTIVEGLIDVASKKPTKRTVYASISEINSILGIEVPINKILSIINNLGISCKQNLDTLECTVPAFRDDIENSADIAEEVIRLYGYDAYDKIEAKVLESTKYSIGKNDSLIELQRKIKQLLVAHQFNECINYSFVPENFYSRILLEDLRSKPTIIANPLSEEMKALRTSMIYGMLNTISYNVKRGNKGLRFFESGRIYIPKDKGYNETEMLSIGISLDNYNFFKLKNIIESVLDLAMVNGQIRKSSEPFYHPGMCAEMVVGDEIVCSFGMIHPKVAKNFDLSKETFYAEFNLDKLLVAKKKTRNLKHVSKFPMVERDLAVVVSEDKKCEELSSAIKSAAGEIFDNVTLFDVYRGENIDKGYKSMAFKIVFSSNKSTLADNEITNAMNKILKSLEFRFGAKLR